MIQKVSWFKMFLFGVSLVVVLDGNASAPEAAAVSACADAPNTGTNGTVTTAERAFVSVVVMGVGVGSAAAMRNAQVNAVLQVLGLYNSGAALAQHYVLLRDEVFTKAGDFVLDTQVIDNQQLEDLVRMTVCVKVQRRGLLAKVAAILPSSSGKVGSVDPGVGTPVPKAQVVAVVPSSAGKVGSVDPGVGASAPKVLSGGDYAATLRHRLQEVPEVAVVPSSDGKVGSVDPGVGTSAPKVLSGGDYAATLRRRLQGAPVVPSVPILPVVSKLDFEPEMVDIPAGSFEMGSPNNEQGREDDERPMHTVHIKAFAMGKYEVTQRQWRAVMGTNPAYFSGCDDCPVERVSWQDVQKYIQQLNAKSGRHYRLPSEAEWEYACRGGMAGQRYRYCGGDDLDTLAWYSSNSGGKTHPVGQKAANRFWLYDMSGNVWEWNQDKWHDSYAGAPTDGSAWETGDSNRHMLRGGSWYSEPDDCRAASRYLNALSYYSLGFRVALPARAL